MFLHILCIKTPVRKEVWVLFSSEGCARLYGDRDAQVWRYTQAFGSTFSTVKHRHGSNPDSSLNRSRINQSFLLSPVLFRADSSEAEPKDPAGGNQGDKRAVSGGTYARVS